MMIDKKNRELQTAEWGKMAEDIAAEYLLTNGYIIRERNWRIGNRIEIDIIAEKDGIIVFVEVKARKGDFQSPRRNGGFPEKKKMIQGETYTCAVCLICFPYRLDIITVTGTPESHEIKHLEDAFLPPLK